MHFYWKVYQGHAVFLLFQIRNTAPILYPIRTPSHPSLSTTHCIQTMVRPTLVPEESYIRIHGRDDAVSHISEYRCIRDSATEAFLHEKAIEMESRDLSRTYLAILPDNEKVIEYITLSIKCMTCSFLRSFHPRIRDPPSNTGIRQRPGRFFSNRCGSTTARPQENSQHP